MSENLYAIEKVPCPGCGGEKFYTRMEATGTGKLIPVDYDCQVCRGTGTVDKQVDLVEALKKRGLLK
jgi:DnaJ-class molecular chaperone